MECLIDLRSDTVTVPDEEMRKVMAAAEVGDDVFREDKTTLRLEELAAGLTGKEAALFVSSGTMGNLLTIMALCGRGTEAVMHEQGHTLILELNGAAAVAGIRPVAVAGERGILTPSQVEPYLKQGGAYYTDRTSLIIIENTHNFCGGTVWQKAEIHQLALLAARYKLPVHMDGARLFNAVAAAGYSAEEACQHVNTVTFCLSKGLGAPVGSVVCGEKPFINELLRLRKMLGGGMRQTGILAAAGIYALENNRHKLKDDHEKARRLAKAFSRSGWAQPEAQPETNIVFVSTQQPAADIAAGLAAKGVLTMAVGTNRLRAVTHLSVSDEQISKASKIIEELF
jgi:threonine aldolase